MGEDEQNLVEGIRGGDDTCFKHVFEANYVDLVRYVQTFVNSRGIAEGLVQEIFIRIWRTKESWDPKGALRAYLWATARNRCLSYLRKERRRDKLMEQFLGRDDLPLSTTEWGGVELNELRDAVESAISELPARRRKVFVLSRYHGMSYAEIAAVMGISIKTVEAQMGHALKYLRDRLAPYRGDI